MIGTNSPESGKFGRFKSSFAASTAYSIDFASLIKVVAFISGPTILSERIIPIASSAGVILPPRTSSKPTGSTPSKVVGIIAIIKFMVFHVLLNQLRVKSLKDFTAPTNFS